ncbi:hypothetical protein [Aeromicrobium sp. CTD01-1L150]|uniref:hypothetical protein n=1 Tax=Aeromicrobium sp. CTD01-1L150 TaxID=3341830 RepID=UPI0035C0E64B
MNRPLPSAIYWRRRFLLLAAVLLVAWVGVTLWPEGEDAETAAPEPSPAAESEPSPSPSATEEAQEVGTNAEETTVSLEAGGDPCDLESIRMTPHVPPEQTTKGKVTIQLALSTTAEEPCTFRPDAGDVAAVISSDGNAVWDSDVCRTTTLLDDPVALSPQWSTVATATWSGRGSGPACDKKEGWASSGKYALRIGTLGGEPGKTTFRLLEKPKKESADEDDEPDEDGGGEDEDTSDES